ncbi:MULTISPECIES: hypothetical protein [unclassified Massilia]|uniref:hypothetical protein n=1 Tax=unclassified Massilia TaxID=2609279 RepID=UPI001B81C162|nr:MULTISPECIES: hypothetical protein [unclassified Massilia]MBQ5942370.1 hypothetical protein [Massilia sp. AB1]MBQ5963980.1 hypothetical protein [Massilia sp. ZL223]
MRIKHLVLFAGAAVLSFTAAAAPQGADTGRVEVRASQPKQVHMKPRMFDRVQGDYALDDGRVLTVSEMVKGQRRVLTADLGDGPSEIIHVGKGKFVAVDKDVRYAFTGADVPDEVVVSTGAGKALALAKR